MDCKPDISKPKQENQEIVEDNENYLEYCFDVRVKVENDLDWDSIQSVLTQNSYQGNISYEHEDYMEKIRCGFDEEYQETINYKEIKQETSIQSIINNVVYDSYIKKTVKYQDTISYDELNEDSLQSCRLCGQNFSNSYSLLQHNLIHFEVPLIKRKIFMCQHCPKYYKKKDDLKNHIIINHYRRNVSHEIPITKQEHKCLICNKTYSYKTWYSHMTEVHCENKFKCPKCDLSFKGKRYLKRHNLLVHEKVQKKETIKHKSPQVTINCSKCPAIFDSKYALATHLRNCHSNEKFTCHLCKSTLKCKSYFLTHLRRVHHNDGLLHQCNMCDKVFKSKRYLKIHIKNAHIKKENS